MFRLGVSTVIPTAGLVLTAVSVARHHRPVELLVQLALLHCDTDRAGRDPLPGGDAHTLGHAVLTC